MIKPYLIVSTNGTGQFISKCLFVILKSPKKRAKIRVYYFGTSSWIVFVRFLGELKTPERHFEIN